MQFLRPRFCREDLHPIISLPLFLSKNEAGVRTMLTEAPRETDGAGDHDEVMHYDIRGDPELH